MITIIKEPPFVSNVLGHQNINTSANYRPLNYLIYTFCSDGVLVYNTLTKKLLLLNEQEYNILKAGGNYSLAMDLFIKSYFLVPIDFDESKTFDQLKHIFKLLDHGDYINSFIILPTTDCNARCFYCCENGQKRINMSSQTAIDSAEFITKKSKGNNVSITWFGGEPLYNVAPINLISQKLHENHINFTSNMISNGFLFSKDLIQTAKKLWNLKSVQITLDGTSDIYNKTKSYIYKNEINPFGRVINNIALLADFEIKVIIRLNMDLFNMADLYSLVDYLWCTFGDNKLIKIYVRLLFDNTSKLQINRTNKQRESLYKEYQKFEDYIYSKGLLHSQKIHSVYTSNTCIGTNRHGTIIMPSGELGLCDLRTDDYHYGNIYDGITNQSIIDSFLIEKERVNSCKTCPILPNCFRLKECMYYTRDCEIYEQESLVKRMQRTIIETYKSWKMCETER